MGKELENRVLEVLQQIEAVLQIEADTGNPETYEENTNINDGRWYDDVRLHDFRVILRKYPRVGNFDKRKLRGLNMQYKGITVKACTNEKIKGYRYKIEMTGKSFHYRIDIRSFYKIKRQWIRLVVSESIQGTSRRF